MAGKTPLGIFTINECIFIAQMCFSRAMKGAISVTVSILRALRVSILINTVYVIEIVICFKLLQELYIILKCMHT